MAQEANLYHSQCLVRLYNTSSRKFDEGKHENTDGVSHGIALVELIDLLLLSCPSHNFLLRAHAFARSVTVARLSAVHASSSRRQERRCAIVCGSPQSQSTDWASSRLPHLLTIVFARPTLGYIYETEIEYQGCCTYLQAGRSSPTDSTLTE